MHYNEDDDVLNRADCVPTFLTAGDPLHERDAEWVVEDELRRFKLDAVFDFVGSSFFDWSHATRIYTYSIVLTSTAGQAIRSQVL